MQCWGWWHKCNPLAQAFPPTVQLSKSGEEVPVTISDQLCCISDHFSEISSQIWLEIHCFSIMSWSLSWLIVSTCTILVQQKLDILVAFTNSVLHRSVQSEFMFQTSKLVFRDISIASIFIQFVCPCPCSVFQFDVEVFLGMVACPPCTSDLLRWPGYAVFVFPFIEIVQSDMHTSISPAKL